MLKADFSFSKIISKPRLNITGYSSVISYLGIANIYFHSFLNGINIM